MLTCADQGTRNAGEITVNFNTQINSGSWLSVLIPFSQHHLAGGKTISYDFTYSGETLSAAQLDLNFVAQKYNATNSTFTDTTGTTRSNVDFIHLRWELIRTAVNGSSFKISYRVIPGSHRFFY